MASKGERFLAKRDICYVEVEAVFGLFGQVFYFQSALKYAMAFWKRPLWERERRKTEQKRVVQRDHTVVQNELTTVKGGLEVLTLLAVAYTKPKVKKEIWTFLRQKGINRSLREFFKDTHRFHISLEQQLRGAIVGDYVALTREQKALLGDLEKLIKFLPTLRRRWGI